MQTTMARRLCERLQKPGQDAVSCCRAAVEECRRCCIETGLLAHDCGVIAVRVLQHSSGIAGQGDLQFVAVTGSQSMGFGYALAGSTEGRRHNVIMRQTGITGTSLPTHHARYGMQFEQPTDGAPS